MLQVRLLGQFKVEVDGTPIDIPSRPAQSLLAYLILNASTAQRREKLAGLFWPDSTEQNARSNLRHALWRIRQALGSDPQTGHDFVTADDFTITFEAAVDDWLDVAILERKISDDFSPDDLIEMISLYQGDLLPGFFEDWVVLERERLQAVFEQKMHLLLERLVEARRWSEVLEWGERWIALGRAPEPAYRVLMIAHNELGDHSSIVTVYQRCVETLQQELGVEPSEQTRELYERLVSGETAPLKPSPALAGLNGQAPGADWLATLPRPSPRALFVAREHELAQLDEFLDLALTGQGWVIFVTGEAGSGKTALVQEFAWRAQELHSDLVVAGGNCNAYTGIGDPYLPFREVLGLLTGDVEARRVTGVIDQEQAGGLWNLVPQAVQALVNAGPDLIDIFIPGPALIARAAMAAPNGEPTPEAARWLAQLEALVARQESSRGRANVQQNALFEQYTRVLQTLAAQRPLLLVLDDLQWADVGSISLLFHLGRRLEGSRILIVGIYRPAEVASGRPSTSSRERERHPLEPVVNEFQRHFGPVHIDLRQAEGERFVQQFLDTEPNRLGPGFQEALYKHTRGHALFTVEMVRGMQERGDLVQDEAGRWVEGPAIDWMTLPARVEGVIGERIGRLATSLQKVLQVASVEGEDFTAEVVAQVRGVDERKIVEQLSSALDRQHRLVRGQGNRRLGAGGPRLSLYRFRHILIQRYLYHNLDEAEQVYLHEAVGQVLERLHGEQTEEAAVQLARHFEVAGLTAKAVKYLRQAGERAVRLSANEEAISHFTRALVLLETLPDTPERTEQELALQIALGVPLIATKGYAAPEVEKAYARARELCHQAHAGETPFLFPALRGLWNNYLQRAELQAAHELAEQLFSLAQNAQDPALLVEAHRALGTTLYFLGEFTQARVRVDQGIALYAPQKHRSLAFVYGADPGLVCRLYAALSLWYLGYPDQALKRMDETLSLAQELAHPHSLAFVLSFTAWLHDERQEGQAAQERAEAAITLST
jgi:predicted ATPase/DNA-binding SARP family transcriptional activator